MSGVFTLAVGILLDFTLESIGENGLRTFEPEFDNYQRDNSRTTVPVHLGVPGYSVP